jgi:hypothetical protein
METRSEAVRAAQAALLGRTIDGASPRRFCEVTGLRAALLGSELGVFECWIWPLKVLHDLQLAFRPAGSERAWLGSEIARSVEVRPSGLTIELAHGESSARARFFAAAEERAVVAAVEVECRSPLEVELRLSADLRPMWPAGLGGQLALADEESGGIVLTEELGRFAVLVASPDAGPARVSADHALPREPLALRAVVTPERARRGPLVFVVAGAEVDPGPLSELARLGGEGAACGHARSRRALEEARALYSRLASGWSEAEDAMEARWQRFLARTARLASDDPLLDEAFLWAKVAIERAWVEVDGVGRGLVAGLAPSGAGERPGFGWIFDGDALFASRAMTGYGDFEGAARALELAASRQRADGKLMHELVLSARLCDWLWQYPYAYYKADSTPAFVEALEHHHAASGDRELASRLAPHAERAYRWCLGALDPDGLVSNRKAGLAAVEAGPLVGTIRAEVYLHGAWLAALSALERLALALGREELAAEVLARSREAREAFERFWSEEHGRYGFARRVDGSLCSDLTAYLAQPLAHGAGEPARALASAEALNSPALASDWGVRFFADDSPAYDPSSYNTGSVFPFATHFAVMAQYRWGQTAAGWQLLRAIRSLHGFSGLGFIPEHLYGDRAEAPPRGVPHQIFSSAALLQSVLYGLLGLELAAAEALLVWRPALPPSLGRIALDGFRVGPSRLDLALERERAGGRTRISARARVIEGPPVKLAFRPWVPALSRWIAWRAAGEARGGGALEPLGGALRVRLPILLEIAGELEVELEYASGPDLEPEMPPLQEGAASEALRVAGVRHGEREVTWSLWGLAGRTYRLPFHSDLPLELDGAHVVESDVLEVAFPAGAPGFVPLRVRAQPRAEDGRP